MIKQVKARRLKVMDTEVGDALWKCRGVVTEAADRLGVSRTLVSERIRKNPQLQYIRDSSRRICFDYAEAGLDDALAEKKPWAILFVLKTLGRTDGLFDPEPRPCGEEAVAQAGSGGPEAARGSEATLVGEAGKAMGGRSRKKRSSEAPIELDEERGRKLDGSHRNLLDALEDGAPWAIKYCLKTFGASKGYAPPKEHAGRPTFPRELMLDPIRRTPETTTYYDVTEHNELWVAGDGTTIDDSTLGDLVMLIEDPYAVDRSEDEEVTVDQPAENAVDRQTVETQEVGASLESEPSQTMIVQEVEGAQSFVEDEPRGAQSLGQTNDGSGELEIRVIKDVRPLTAQKTASQGAQSQASRGAQSQRELNLGHRRGERDQTAVAGDVPSVADNNPRGSDPTGPGRVPLRLEWAGNEVAKSLDPDVGWSQTDAEDHAAEQHGDAARGRCSC